MTPSLAIINVCLELELGLFLIVATNQCTINGSFCIFIILMFLVILKLGVFEKKSNYSEQNYIYIYIQYYKHL
jgi:hypothetical protein